MRLRTVTIYKCDTCHRTTGLFQNNEGLDVVSRCVITQACKGILRKIGEKQQPFVEPNAPDLTGLEDWSKRPAYFKHIQPTTLRTWRIKHGLNGQPSIRAFAEQTSEQITILNTSPSSDGYFVVAGNFTGGFKPGTKFTLKKINGAEVNLSVITVSYDPVTDKTTIAPREAITFVSAVGGVGNDVLVLGLNTTTTLTPVIPSKVEYTSPDIAEVTFNQPTSGIAECIIRNITQVVFEEKPIVESTLRQIVTANFIVNIGTQQSDASLNFDLQFISPVDNRPSVRRTMTFTLDQLYLSPWASIAKIVLVNGKRYYVRAMNVTALFDNILDGSKFYITPSTSNVGDISKSIILVSKAPHQNVDKDPTVWVNMSDLNVNAIESTDYRNGVLSCLTDLYKTAYPPIRILS